MRVFSERDLECLDKRCSDGLTLAEQEFAANGSTGSVLFHCRLMAESARCKSACHPEALPSFVRQTYLSAHRVTRLHTASPESSHAHHRSQPARLLCQISHGPIRTQRRRDPGDVAAQERRPADG